MSDVDAYFVTQIAGLVPALVHRAAFHVDKPSFAKVYAEIAALMTSLERAECLLWEICEQLRKTHEQHHPDEELLFQPFVQEPGRPLEIIAIDAADPDHRAMFRYAQCAAFGDRETAKAVFASIDNITDVNRIINGLLGHAARVLAHHETCPR